MRAIAPESSVLVYWGVLVYVEAALLADDAAKELASPVTETLDGFPKILQLDLDSQRAQIRASARSVVADGKLDGVIRGLYSAVLHLVAQDRKRPELKTLFPTTIGDAVRFALRKQLDVAGALVEKLSFKYYPDDLREAHTKELNKAMKHGRSVVQELTDAETARGHARIDIKEWKTEANKTLRSVYGQLVDLGAQKGQPPKWADMFFPRTPSSVVDDEEPAADAKGGESAKGGEAAKPADGNG
ncbi:MAG: hypothetical protein U0441_13615 [Polyangiaceae bacterium]